MSESECDDELFRRLNIRADDINTRDGKQERYLCVHTHTHTNMEVALNVRTVWSCNATVSGLHSSPHNLLYNPGFGFLLSRNNHSTIIL